MPVACRFRREDDRNNITDIITATILMATEGALIPITEGATAGSEVNLVTEIKDLVEVPALADQVSGKAWTYF